MKIKIKKIIESESEVELSLPAYFTHTEKVFKIISESEMIEVRPKTDGREWAYMYVNNFQSDVESVVSTGVIVSEDEFKSAVASVAHHINKLIQEHLKITEYSI